MEPFRGECHDGRAHPDKQTTKFTPPSHTNSPLFPAKMQTPDKRKENINNNNNNNNNNNDYDDGGNKTSSQRSIFFILRDLSFQTIDSL